MTWEVEQKYPLVDPAALRQRLQELGAAFQPAEQQTDEYFNHPARDFSATDEAFRLRRAGQKNLVTYKGPKVDRTTKTRQEIELPLPAGEATIGQFRGLFLALGFRPAGTVSKSRAAAALAWQGHSVHIAFDEVQRLGSFIELEIAAEDDELETARAALQSLSQRLGLTSSERRSYLELLQQQTIATGDLERQ
jgi:adenylate cyclase class 2